MSYISLAPTWTFACRVYCEVLKDASANPEVKRQAEQDLLQLAQSYEALAVKVTEQKDEIEQLKTRIHDMLEEQSVAEAKARIDSAQIELLMPVDPEERGDWHLY